MEQSTVRRRAKKLWGRAAETHVRGDEASAFLRGLGFSGETDWTALLQRAEQLLGRPVVVVDTLPSKAYTGMWVVVQDIALVMLRKHDNPNYQLVSRLHEIAHVLVSYAPEGIVEGLIGSVSSSRLNGSIVRLCAADESGAPLDAVRLEQFVEDVALELEFLITVRTMPAEAHL